MVRVTGKTALGNLHLFLVNIQRRSLHLHRNSLNINSLIIGYSTHTQTKNFGRVQISYWRPIEDESIRYLPLTHPITSYQGYPEGCECEI